MGEKLKTTDRSDSELIEACLNGDPMAFEPLVERYQNFALALALGHVRNYHDAQEIVQEAFVKAYCKLVQLKDRDGFPGWFRSIVLNGCYTWLSRQSRAPISLNVVDASELAGLSLQRHRIDALQASVWDAVYALPEMYRTVVLLHYMNDFSYDEIAQWLDVSVTTVKGRLQQARLKLKHEFQPEEKETLKMSRADTQFTKQVQSNVLQIASEPIKETISLGDTKHLVLFFGLANSDIEVRQGDKVGVCEIVGTKHSLGVNKEGAERSVAAIQIYADTTENYWEDGPHPVERFAYTRDTTIGVFHSSTDEWKELRDQLMAEEESVVTLLRHAPQRATRVTIGRQKGEDILIPDDAYTPEVQRVFTPNCISDDGLHGPRGSVSLVLSIPKGVHLTMVNEMEVKIYNVRNDLNLLSDDASSRVFLDSVEGTVCLYGIHLEEAKNLKGKLVQHLHHIRPERQVGPYVIEQNKNPYETKLQQIEGEIDLDVVYVLIEATEIEGKTRIKNRFGTTRFYQTAPQTNGTCEISSTSGDIFFFLNEDAVGVVNVYARTCCGKIDVSGLKGQRLGRWSGQREINVVCPNSISPEQAEIQVCSEAGEIHIEKIPAR